MFDIVLVVLNFCSCFFCFKQKTAYEMRISDWSSDVCSSDLFVGVWVLAWIINALAPTFEATRNPVQAMKVAAYSATAAWVAGVFQIVPSLGWIGAILGLYSLYLLYPGLPILMKAPAAKAMAYPLATIVAANVLLFVLSPITAAPTTPLITP